MPKRALVSFSFVSMLMTGSLYADSQTGIGLVVIANSPATAKNKEGVSRTLSRRSPLYAGDTIQVGVGGKVQIKFSDASMMTLQEKSEFRVDSYKNEKANDDAFSSTLLKGSLRTLTGAISKRAPKGYKVSTPVAAMGVRGTFYSCRFDDSNADLTCAFFRGAGFMENAFGRLDLGMDESFDYGEVPGAKTEPSGTLSQPMAFNEGETLAAAQTEGVGASDEGVASFTDEDLETIESDIDAEAGIFADDAIDDLDDMLDEEDVLDQIQEDETYYP